MCICVVKSTGINKVIYGTENHAWIAVRYGQHFDLRPYPCPSGVGWHIGHPSNGTTNVSNNKKSKSSKLSKGKQKWIKFSGATYDDDD